MISKLEQTDFPLSKEQCESALQLLAQQIHARYTSPFSFVIVLPQSLWFGKKLEELLLEDGAMPLTVGFGVLPTTKDGKPAVLIIEPPSEHSIKNRKCVVFDAQGDWFVTMNVCEFVRRMRPSSIEVASFISRGEVPAWVNTDYVCFETPLDILVSGIGLGYTQDAVTGAALTAERVALTLPEETKATEEESRHADNPSSE
jgi:hypoxanthine-guanine phosphoribosyltransferase